MAEFTVWYVLIAAGIWAASGLIALWWLTRQGYRDPRWILMAIVLGPVFAAIVQERSERIPRTLYDEGSDADAASRIRTLVGVDGSAASERALETVVDLLGADRTWLLLVHVVPYDIAESTESEDTAAITAIQAELASKAERIGGQAIESIVVAGAPARTLLQLAKDHDVDLIALGRHGSGLSKAVMGNVAQKVSHLATTAVLIIGDDNRPPATGD
ncbi:universal stress protein [Glycomyces sp. L485]|uniref:universal stress protein n=1 Tax=Glycomyces sp. L485 TaxID=2909235 RepID=UPI001F4A981B|nr:universal stress protein [Glycomyces sp. L485]MCH7232722.1 universal stress protein [Glycomyces sp. L485]